MVKSVMPCRCSATPAAIPQKPAPITATRMDSAPIARFLGLNSRPKAHIRSTTRRVGFGGGWRRRGRVAVLGTGGGGGREHGAAGWSAGVSQAGHDRVGD